MRKVIFIGGIGSENEFGGELNKNKLIVSKLVCFFDKVFIVDTYRSRKKIWKLWKLPFLILFYINSTIIYSTSYKNVRLLDAIIYYIFPKRKKVLWAIGGDLHKQIENDVYKLKYFYRFSSIIVEGNLIKKHLNGLGLNNVCVRSNFKSITYIPDIKQKKMKNISLFKFVFFSRITKYKGVDDIIVSTKYLNDKGFYNKYVIDFYGPIESSYRTEFLNKIADYENLNYCGIIDLSNKSGYDVLSSYHLFIFPTYWSGEGFPGVFIDSLIAGVPILSTNWGLNGEVINSHIGFLVPPRDFKSIVFIIEQIIAGKVDLKPMYMFCQKECHKYNYENVISKELFDYI